MADQDHDDDAGAAFDRAAARAARQEEAVDGPDRLAWLNQRRYRTAVGRFVLVVFLLPAHIVAVRAVTGLLIAHLVLVAVLASQVARTWLARRDASPLPPFGGRRD